MVDEPAPTPGQLDLEPASPSSPRPSGRLIAAVVGAVALVAAGIFAVGAMSDDDGNTPEDAVVALLSAAAEEDVIGVLEQLDPGERDALRPGLTDLVDELNRLEILGGADLDDVAGIDLELDDLQVESEAIADDLARVRVVGGTSRVTVDPAALPLGDLLLDLLGGRPDSDPETSESELGSGAAAEDDGVVTVRRDGRWYVSLGHTVAEAARLDAGVALEDIEAVTARGAGSAEDAVRELLEASAGLDVRRVIELLPPGELGALHRYAGLFVDDAEAGLAEAQGRFSAEITDLELRTGDGPDGARKVYVEELALVAESEGMRFEIADGCVTATGPDGAPQRSCGADGPSVFDGLNGLGLGIVPPELSVGRPEIGFVVVEEDGEWFVSPTRTGIDAVVAILRAFDREDVEELVRWTQELIETMSARGSAGALPLPGFPLPTD